MNDYLDDAIALRLAGYYTPGVDPDEDSPAAQVRADIAHAARPGHMPSMADVVAERDLLRGLVRELVGKRFATPYVRAHPRDVCVYCHRTTSVRHAADCPWRLAAEYFARIDGQKEND